MTLDLSTLQYVTESQFVNLAHNSVSKPAIIIFYLMTLLFFGLASLIVSPSTKKEKKMIRNLFIWFTIGVTVVGGLLFFLPQLSYRIGDWVVMLFTSGA